MGSRKYRRVCVFSACELVRGIFFYLLFYLASSKSHGCLSCRWREQSNKQISTGILPAVSHIMIAHHHDLAHGYCCTHAAQEVAFTHTQAHTTRDITADHCAYSITIFVKFILYYVVVVLHVQGFLLILNASSLPNRRT